MASDTSSATIEIIVAIIIVLGILLYFFVIRPFIYDITVWWDLGHGTWFIYGLIVGAFIGLLVGVYAGKN